MKLSELKPYRCRKCRNMLARTNGLALFCCSMELHVETIVRCSLCGDERTWEPDKSRPLATIYPISGRPLQNP